MCFPGNTEEVWPESAQTFTWLWVQFWHQCCGVICSESVVWQHLLQNQEKKKTATYTDPEAWFRRPQDPWEEAWWDCFCLGVFLNIFIGWVGGVVTSSCVYGAPLLDSSPWDSVLTFSPDEQLLSEFPSPLQTPVCLSLKWWWKYLPDCRDRGTLLCSQWVPLRGVISSIRKRLMWKMGIWGSDGSEGPASGQVLQRLVWSTMYQSVSRHQACEGSGIRDRESLGKMPF
jgi:hypothetical protein